MADIQPFPALRPRPDVVSEVASPPYDVVTRDEAREMITQNPKSFMRIIRPDVEGDPSWNRNDDRVFELGARTFANFAREELLLQDEAPCLYLYELSTGDHVQIGVVAGASLDEYEQGAIKRHEKTREPELIGRTKHIEALGANTGPVFMTYRARPEIDAAVDRMRSATPAHDFSARGVRHRLWVISQPGAIRELQTLFADVPALYIADGHHRTAASHRVRELRWERGVSGRGVVPHDHFLTVIFPHDQLRILAYNRVIIDLGERSAEAVLEAVSERFDITPTDTPTPTRTLTFGMYVGGKWHRLETRAADVPQGDALASLDVAILQEKLLKPVFGIEQPRTDPRIRFLGGIRGTGELERRADAYKGAAFCLYPVSIEQVMAIADAGEVMPPKSTWFEPKLLSGLVVRSIQDPPRLPGFQSAPVGPHASAG